MEGKEVLKQVQDDSDGSRFGSFEWILFTQLFVNR